MLRNDAFHLRNMREAAEVSRSFVENRDRTELDSDLLLFYALMKAVEIVGEAANHVSQGFRANHAEIEWEDIVGMRNWLVHAYYNVDREVIWETVQNDIPTLLAQLESALDQPHG